MDSQQREICFNQVLRQAQHERNINALRQRPFALSLSKGSCYEAGKGEQAKPVDTYS